MQYHITAAGTAVTITCCGEQLVCRTNAMDVTQCPHCLVMYDEHGARLGSDDDLVTPKKCKRCSGRLGAQDPGDVCGQCKHRRRDVYNSTVEPSPEEAIRGPRGTFNAWKAGAR